MATTIRDVAARAGVSSATGSLVLSGKARGRVSPTTADRVRAAASELGYRNPRRAGALGPIGLLSLGGLSQSLVVHSVDAAHQEANRLDLEVLTIDVPDEAALPRGLERLGQLSLSGTLIVADGRPSVRLPEVLPGPVVLVGATTDRPEVDSVVPDHGVGQQALLSEIDRAGHHRVGWICHRPSEAREAHPLEAIRAATSEFTWDDHPDRLVQVDGAAVNDGFEAMKGMLARYPGVTAVVCQSDRIAMGVYLACWESGLRIPDDLSVVGIDGDTAISQALRPALTTVPSPYHDMGRWAVRRLVDRLQADPGHLSSAQVRLPSWPVVGESVAPPRVRP